MSKLFFRWRSEQVGKKRRSLYVFILYEIKNTALFLPQKEIKGDRKDKLNQKSSFVATFTVVIS